MSRDSTLADSKVGPDHGGRLSEDISLTEAISKIRGPELPRRRRGEAVGRYVVLDPLGHGGMGVVYAAYDPELDRRVALKLLRGGDDPRAHTRLLREAQAMARVIHPNVITVHDVGSVEGSVFVAMELVDGVHLGQWLKAQRRGWEEIVANFVLAGRGLQAAHQAGVLHRDFKPANVLVGNDGEVRVVDFGLARQLEGSVDSMESHSPESEDSTKRHLAQEDLGLTRTGAALGTPAYMAPEQHSHKKLDARTDQFSFCVALYEALFGERPFKGSNRVALAVATNRGEIQPPPKGHAVPSRIVRAVMRGLSAASGDRFPTMEELLAELSYDPGRRKRQAAVGVVAVLALTVGVYGYAREPEKAPVDCPNPAIALEDAWDAAQRKALDEAFLSSGLPYAVETRNFVAQRLDRWAQTWGEARAEACEATRVRGDVPESTYQLRVQCLDRQRNDLAAVTRVLVEGKVDALEHADRLAASLPDPDACHDLEALSRIPPPADEATRAIVEQVREQISEIRALEGAGRYTQGLELARTAHKLAETTGYQPVVAEATHALGTFLDLTGDRAQSEAMLHRAARAATEARDDAELAAIWLDLAWDLGMGQSRYDEALRWTDYAESIVNRLGRPDRLTSRMLCNQGTLYWAKRDNEEGLTRLDACLEIRERIMPGDPLIANTLSYIGNSYIDLGKLPEAETHFRRGLAIATAAHGNYHPLVASMQNGLGVTLYHQRRLADAQEAYKTAYNINRMILGPDAPDLLYSLGNIAGCDKELGQYEKALATMWRVEELVRKNFPADHREAGTTAHNIGELLALQGEQQRALAYYERALPIRTTVHGDDHPYIANTLTGMAEVLLSQGETTRAHEALERALQIRTKAADPNAIDFGRTRFALAQALTALDTEPQRARALVIAARADYDTADSPLQQERRDAMDRWLREHAPSTP